MRTSRSPGTSRSVSPGATGPPRRLPVTTVPRPRTAKTRSIASRAPAGRARRASTTSAASASRTSSIPSPVCADASSTGTPASVVRASSAWTSAAQLVPPRGVGREVRLRHHRQPAPDPERVEQLEVLERLRVRPVVRGDDEQRRVDLARPDEHVADQPVVARHVDEVDHPPVVERQVRIPDVDRHPAPPLLGQPVRVDAGERAQERRLAVVDVPGRADDEAGGGSRGVLSHRRRRPGSRR